MTSPTIEINGWTIYAHPLFLDQLDEMIAKVELAKAKDPLGYKNKRPAKLLAAVMKVAFEDIPSDPTRADYRQGGTLGASYKHWFRATFLQQFRLFFRCNRSNEACIIILAWVNDEKTLRAYGSATDAYAVFRGMLDRGDPPDSWEALLAQAAKETGRRRLKDLRTGRDVR